MTLPNQPTQSDAEQALDRILANLLDGQDQSLSWSERKSIFVAGIVVAEKLDEFVRRLDPIGEPPRFEALMFRRLGQMERQYKSISGQSRK